MNRAPSLFISYRRDDTTGLAAVLARDLKADLGLSNVFRDTDDLRPGLDFTVEIERRVMESNITIALIGPAWSGPAHSDLLSRSDDWVRREIRMTFESGGGLIPVLVDGGRLPSPLPTDIERLARLQHMEWDSGNPDASYHQLLAAVWYLTVRDTSDDEILIIGEDWARGRLALAKLVEALEAEDTPGARALSQIAVGLRAVTVHDAARRWPDVIVVCDGEPSPTQLQRLDGVGRHRRIHRLAIVSSAALLAGGGAALSAARLVDLDGGTVATVGQSGGFSGPATAGAETGRIAGWWHGLGTVGSVGVVGAGVAAVAIGIAVASPGPPDDPPAALTTTTSTVVSVTQTTPAATAPVAEPDTSSTQPNDPTAGAAPEFTTPVVSDEERCDLILEGMNGDPADGNVPESTVDLGDTLTVCATGFFPFDVGLAVTAPDGGSWDSQILALASDGGALAHEAGSRWDSASFAMLPGTPLGTYEVIADVGQDAKNEAATAATRAASEGGPPVTGGGSALARFTVVQGEAPRVTVDPPTGPAGTVFDVGVAGMPPGIESAVHVYALDGPAPDEPDSETWTHVTSIVANIDSIGQAIATLPTAPDEPVGRYLLVLSSDTYTEFELR